MSGLVKKGNDILQMKLGSWIEEISRGDWCVGLRYVIWYVPKVKIL
ncbi:15335_t:CDS:2 [Gigaspora rosea]|nr:15335_t:CDS:2 [Gigaspora rosea]